MSDLNTHQVMRAEVKADVYGGDECDQVTKQFEIYCDGDMDSDTNTEDIVIKLADLPPGTKISVEYPCCPECSLPREDIFKQIGGGALKIVGHKSKCQCGFDWDEWVQNEYS